MKTNYIRYSILTGVLLCNAAMATQVALDVSLTNPLLEADKKQSVFLKVGLRGFELPSNTRRARVNLALVIDKSGSMQGEKIKQAKEAALMAVSRLRDDDIISILAYDNSVQVLVPATRASDRVAIRKGIEQLSAGGSTALYAGVSKGAGEVRKFFEKNQVNRVILLSDGQANVGPKTPGALGELGASLVKERISVTTIGLGLGYNEDLMARLARQSDGNHAFVENPYDLARIFNSEFGDVLSVVAQEVEVKIRCTNGVRPIRVLGRDADIAGQFVVVRMNQLYSCQEKYVMLEVEIPSKEAGESINVASVDVVYDNITTSNRDRLASTVGARFTKSKKEVQQRLNKEVMAEAVMQIGVDVNEKAVALRDQGKVEEAQKLLFGNGNYLKKNALALGSKELDEDALRNYDDSKNLEGANWNYQRKSMRSRQYNLANQQDYGIAPIKK